MALAGEVEGPLDRGTIDRRHRQGGAAGDVPVLCGRGVELLDDGEEIGQQLAVLYGCLCLSRYCWASEWSAL